MTPRKLAAYIDDVALAVETYGPGPDFFPIPETSEKALLYVISDLKLAPDENDDELGFCTLLEYLRYAYEALFPPKDFWKALEQRLEEDYKVWGNVWRTRTVHGVPGKPGQVERTIARLQDYLDKTQDSQAQPNTEEMVLKAAGNIYICLVRILDPYYMLKKED